MNNDFLKMLQEMALIFPAFVLVLTFRGFFRALIATMMGDDTAQEEGFLTLNPVAHIDVLGLSIILLVILVFGALVPNILLIMILVMLGFRWSYEVPIDETRFVSPRRGVVLTALSGSFGNFFLALLFLYLIAHFPLQTFPPYVVVPLLQVFQTIVQFSIFFGVFNLIPLPPFDGGVALLALFPQSWQNVRDFFEDKSFFMLIFLLLIFALFMPFLGKMVLIIERMLWKLVI